MRVALDISPLSDKRILSHRVRGTGFYTQNLKDSLGRYTSLELVPFDSNQIPNDCDIVHYPYFEPFTLTLPKKRLKKTVVTVHDLTPLVFPRAFPSGIRGKIKWHIQKTRLKEVDMVITDSESSKKDILKYTNIPEDKVKVIYLAAGENFKEEKISGKEKEELSKKYNLPDRFVLYVGDATWNKNLPRLMRAVREIDVPIVMVGKTLIEENFDKSNPWNKDLVEVKKLTDANKKVINTGFVEERDLIRLYNLASVFVMPSLYEGFGLPLLEAMNCGCPTVTTKEGSLLEVGGQAPVYVDAYSETNIADGIYKVYNDSAMQSECSKKSLDQAQKFSWKETAIATEKVYKSVV